MERVYVREQLDAPIEVVWGLIRDFGDITAWASAARVVRTEGTGVGMIRHIDGPAGRFVERCEAHDDAAHAFAYRLLESPLPANNFVANVRLTAVAPECCIIEWGAEFEAPAAPDLHDRIEEVYRDGFIGTVRKTLSKAKDAK